MNPRGSRRVSPRRRRFPARPAVLPRLVLPVLTLLAYAPSLSNDLVWDDRQLILQNRYLHEGAAGEMLRHGIFSGAGREHGFYRPLQILTYHLDLLVWGRAPVRPWTLRLTNILLHAANALLVLWVLGLLFPGRRRAAWVAALLFAAHPLASESVAYVAGRADLLVLAGSLASLGFLIRFARSGRGADLLGSYACFALALLSKEMALVVPPLLVLAWMARERGGGRVRDPYGPWGVLAPVAGHAALVGLYVVVRARLLQVPSALAGGGDLGAVIATYASYGRILLWPDVLHMERLTLPAPLADPGYLLPWIALLALAAALLAATGTRRAAVFGVAWYLIALVPVSNLWPLNAAMAEHWLYLPGIGLLWLVGLLAEALAGRTRSRERVVAAVLLVVLALLGARTARRCLDWRTSRSIFEATLRHSPNSSRAHTGLGAVLGREGRVDEAIAHLRRALELDPADEDACNNLGAAFGRRGQLDSCAVYLERALRLQPRNADTHNNLGNAYAILGQRDDALRAYRQALRLDPGRTTTYLNLARVYGSMGATEDARRAYEAFLARAGPELEEQRAAAERALTELRR